jgi:mono/diheme cytochrome c family protein
VAIHDSGVYQTVLFAILLTTFRRDVAPILQRECVRCHGQDGVMDSGLDLRSYAALRRGGNLGDDVVHGNPDQSLIVLIEGRRGPEHRMSLHREPLSPREIRVIRVWIEQDAKR